MQSFPIIWRIISILIIICCIASNCLFYGFYTIPRSRSYVKSECLVMNHRPINGSCLQTFCRIMNLENLCRADNCQLTMVELYLEQTNAIYNVTTTRKMLPINIVCYYELRDVKRTINVDYVVNAIAVFYSLLFASVSLIILFSLGIFNCVCCLLR